MIVASAAEFPDSRYPSNYKYPVKYEGPSQQSFQEKQSSQESQLVLKQYGATELFRESVETARLGIQQSLAGSEKVGEAVRPKLTIDLSHKDIESIPDEIVDLMKKDVER